ncbi:MAG TPA: SDR family oxidoreductase [Ktedonobacterales bacterium]|jgi:NAD(P)-dependent dehydrogenase (short-subunit alcohol dehydrogenase family)
MRRNKPEVVVVTGASAGLGRAIVQEFAKHGAQIGLLARGRERLEATRKEVEALGGQALALPTDVADYEQVERAAEAVEQAFGPIAIWINNAMVGVMSPVKDMEPEEYKRVTAVTYLGQIYGTLAALKRMLPRDHGKIVLIGSALAYRGIPLQSAYCGAKHAIQGFADSLHSELLHDQSKVSVTMVQMPAMNTPQFNWMKTRLPRKAQPVPPIYQPEVAARAVYWAAHHQRRRMEVGLSTAIAINGNKLAQWLGDWYLAKTGYDSQQYDGEVPSNRPDNLWEPAPGNYGAHGDFDQRAKNRSLQVWLNTHRGLVSMAAVGAAAASAAGVALLRGRA